MRTDLAYDRFSSSWHRGWIASGLFIAVLVTGTAAAGGWREHTVWQLNGSQPQVPLPAEFQYVPNPEPTLMLTPYLVYIPQKDRVMMSITRDRPHQTAVLHSDDHGATWSEPRFISTDAEGRSNAGMCLGLSYLGNGRLVVSCESHRFFSDDYGETWQGPVPIPKLPNGRVGYVWDPMVVDLDPRTGECVRVTETRSVPTGLPWGTTEGVYTEAMVWWSTDGGKTFSDPIFPPAWHGISEINTVRAANGDLIAACRTEMPERFAAYGHDHYCGLGISIYEDNGKTWSPVDRLFEYGRHHASLAVLPDETLVMAYNVRMGYPDTAGSYPWPSYGNGPKADVPESGYSPEVEPFPLYGIEAVVSRDHGRTWDLDHRYLLAVYQGSISTTAENVSHYWDSAAQGTSTLVLPDGSLLTAFGSGHRVDPDPASPQFWPRDIGLVHWRLNPEPVNDETAISDAADTSELRNRIDPMANRPEE